MDKRSELVGLLGTLVALAAVAGAAYSGSNGGLYSSAEDSASTRVAMRSLPKTHNCTWTDGGLDRMRSTESSPANDASDFPAASVTASL